MLSIVLNYPAPFHEEEDDEKALELPASITARICQKYENESLFVPLKQNRIRSPLKEHIPAIYTELPPSFRHLLNRRVRFHKDMDTGRTVFLNVSKEPPFHILDFPNLTFQDIRVAALLDVAIRHDPGIIKRGTKKWLLHVLARTENVQSWWSSISI